MELAADEELPPYMELDAPNIVVFVLAQAKTGRKPLSNVVAATLATGIGIVD